VLERRKLMAEVKAMAIINSAKKIQRYAHPFSLACYDYCLITIPVMMIIILTEPSLSVLSNSPLLHSFPIPSISPTTHYHHHAIIGTSDTRSSPSSVPVSRFKHYIAATDARVSCIECYTKKRQLF
jgi:hypothetical protein